MSLFSRLLQFVKNLIDNVTTFFLSGRKKELVVSPEKQEPPPKPLSYIVRQEQEHACDAYMKLKLQFRDAGRMAAIAETMGRDFLTAMPDGAWKSRLVQISFLHRRMHEDINNAGIAGQLERAQSHLSNHAEDWDEWDCANLREMEDLYKEHSSITGELVEKKASLSYEGRRRHRDALAAGDWAQAREFLSSTIDLHRHIADLKCKAMGHNSLYQVLMAEHMPGIPVSDVEDWFGGLEKKLSKMLPQILEKQNKEPEPLDIKDFYPAKAQMWLNRALLSTIGFDFERGGLYETGHNPVEGGTPDDTRLVIKNVDTTNFLDSMKSTLHEGGHGLYIQGLPRKIWRYQPVARDMSAALHESQALLIEMIMGRTKEFFTFLSPRVEGLFHGLQNPVLSAENLHALKTRVNPSVSRKKADEVTYFFHILHRFRLERDLIEGKLKPVDLPEAWNEGMEELLGITPENHTEGCMQDVHWFVGKFGYFPAYAVGHMMAAQQYEAINRDLGPVGDMITKGDFIPVKEWLNDNVHGKGRLLSVNDLMKQATGKNISPDFLVKHLEQRYLSVA